MVIPRTPEEIVAQVDRLLVASESLEVLLENVMYSLAIGMTQLNFKVRSEDEFEPTNEVRDKWAFKNYNNDDDDGNFSNKPFFIKTWYIDDPISFEYQDLPLAVITTDSPTRTDQYVLLDNEVTPVTIYFFPPAINRAKDYKIGTRATKAMYDRASRLIRIDPTMNNKFYNVLIDGSVIRQPGFTGSGDINTLELKLRTMRRLAW